jgi:periplasmic divalent cation tolerance protein
VTPEGSGTNVCVLLSTCPPAEAERLATLLVEGGHAACVNIAPRVTSIYRWEGKLQKDEESLLVIKCARARIEALREALVAAHPYDVPEVVALEVAAGHAPYVEWVLKSAGGA